MKNPVTVPFLRITVSFSIGILYAHFYPVQTWIIAVLVIVCAATSLRSRNSIIKGALMLLSTFLLGNYTSKIHQYKNHLKGFEVINGIEGVIVSTPTRTEKKLRYLLDVSKVNTTNGWKESQAQVLMYTDNDQQLEYGDKVLCKASLNEIKAPANPHQFDLKEFYARKGIFHRVFVKKGNLLVLDHQQGNSVYALAMYCRNKAEALLNTSISSKNEAQIACAMLLGDRDALNQETSDAYASTGALHVLAVSGLHVGILYLILHYCFYFFPKRGAFPVIQLVFTLIIIWCYAFISGLSPSVVRSTIMFSFLIIATTTKSQSNPLNTVFLSAFLILVVDPNSLFSPGFQLSYAAVIGIIVLQPWFNHLITTKYKVIKYLWALTSVSLAAQVATFPISVYYFHQFPTYFFITNIVVIPAAFLIMVLGIIFFVTSFLSELSQYPAFLLEGVIYGLNQSIFAISHFSGVIISNIYLSITEVLILFGTIMGGFRAILCNSKVSLYMTTICCLVLMIEHLYIHKESINEKRLVVYHVKHKTAIAMTSGELSTLFFNDSINQKEYRYHLKNDFNFHHVTKVLQKKLNPVQLLDWNHHKIMTISSRKGLSLILEKELIHPDILILSNDVVKNLQEIATLPSHCNIIFDSSNSIKNDIRLRKQNESFHLNCHFVNLDQAFVLTD